MDSAEIKRQFTDYYKSMGYQPLPGARMIDPSIPMSFVMSAGLIQVENSLAISNYREGDKYVLVQNCFRHFDLEKIGTDDIHLSYFEMPGAFIFGSSNKADTIHRMWLLATSVMGIATDRVWVSYFNGGKVLNNYLPNDEETYKAWREAGVPDNHIIGLGTEHNYWIQGKGIEGKGVTHKCGPNTELFFDRGESQSCSLNCKPGCNCGRFVEFSNSLFICSEISEGTLRPIDRPFTETVIGAERVAMIRQKAQSVFEISDIRPVIDVIRNLTHASFNGDNRIEQERILADHMKGLYFLVADGAPPPGKDGRARIVKILIRRIITGQIALGVNPTEFLPLITQRIQEKAPSDMKAEWIRKKLFYYFLSESLKFTKTIKRGFNHLLRLIVENDNKTLTESQIIDLEKQWGLPRLLASLFLERRETCYESLTSYEKINGAAMARLVKETELC